MSHQNVTEIKCQLLLQISARENLNFFLNNKSEHSLHGKLINRFFSATFKQLKFV